MELVKLILKAVRKGKALRIVATLSQEKKVGHLPCQIPRLITQL